jgi:spore maturation protein CgeB
LTTILQIGEINRRVSVLAALPEALRLAVATDHFPAALRARPNLRHLGYIDDFGEIRALMRRSRIVLNITGKFPAGSHERIWFAMAEGAVVVTDRSVFMKQDFTDGETIVYLPQSRLAPSDLAPLAALAHDTKRLDRMAADAMAIYRNRHTWTKRAQLLIDAAQLI